MQEYNERKNKKLTNNLLCTDEAKFWVTSSRPSNFGDPIDTKTKVDNWFDENRYSQYLNSPKNSYPNTTLEYGMKKTEITRLRELRFTCFKALLLAATC